MLRAEMLTSMGEDVDADRTWRSGGLAWFAERLGSRHTFAAFVIDRPNGVPVSCAAGDTHQHAPSSRNPFGLHGHVSNVSTLPAYRGRGFAGACLAALLECYDRGTDVRVIDLSATAVGAGLYRAAGFTEPGDVGLRRRSWRTTG